MTLLSVSAVVGLFCVISANATESSNLQLSSPQDEMSALSLEDIINVKVTVASLFEERDLDAGASVASINSQQWRLRGARRTFEALRYVPGTMVLPSLGASQAISIRGYASNLSTTGIAALFDGAPINSFSTGTALFGKANIDLGVLDKIEMIRGPGSTIYGSDAFHGVVSLQAADFDKDTLSGGAQTGSFGYYQADLKYSKELRPNLRWSFNYGLSGQNGEMVEYRYQDFTSESLTSGGLVVLNSANNRPIPVYRFNGEVDQTYRRYYNSNTLVSKIRYKKAELGFYWNRFNALGFMGATPTPLLTQGSSRTAVLPGPIVTATNLGWTDLGRNGAQNDEQSNFWMVRGSNTWTLPQKIELETRAYFWKNSHDFVVGRTPGPATESLNLHQQDERAGLWVLAKRAQDESFPTKAVVGYALDYSNVPSATYKLREINSNQAINDGANGKSRTINALIAQTDTGLFGNKFHVLAGTRFDAYSDVGNHVSPRGGLIFLPTDNSAIKLLYNHAFRAPFAGELGGTSVIKGNPDLRPETLDMAELLYMSRSKKWKYEVGVFGSRWRNAIASRTNLNIPIASSGEVFISEYYNGAQSRAYGFEADGRYNVLAQTAVTANGSLIRSYSMEELSRTEYFNFPKIIFNWGIEQEVPQWRLTVGLYNHHEFDRKSTSYHVRPAGQDYPGTTTPVNFTWADPSSRRAFDLRNYFRTDLGVAWDFGKTIGQYQLTLNIKNLFDRRNVMPSIWNQLNNGIPEAGINGTLGIRATL